MADAVDQAFAASWSNRAAYLLPKFNHCWIEANPHVLRDGNEIRKMAIRSNIPLITNLRLAESLARALEAESKPEYLEIGEYW